MNSIVDAFENLVARHPDRPLVSSPAGTINARGLDADARRLETELAASLPRPGTTLGLSAPNGPAFLYGLLMLRRRGIAALMLDPKAPPLEHQRICRLLGAGGVLRSADGWAGPGDWSLETTLAPDEPAEIADAGDEVGIVKLTSGSTGDPRGILTPDQSVLQDDRALRSTMGIQDTDRLLAAIPFSHSYGLSSLVLPCLAAGLQLVLPGPGTLSDPMAAAATLGATVFPTAPAYLHAVMRRPGEEPLPAGIRRVISAGALLAPEVARRFRELTRRSVHVFYGASECGGICYDREGGAAERGTVGTPVDGVSIELGVNGFDEPGVVRVRSPSIARGYLPGLPGDAQRLGSGGFLSDDLGVWRAGELALQGRAGEWINVDGRKVNPHEVESVLLEMEGVQQAAVCGLQVAERSGEILCALLAGDKALDYESITRFCRTHLAPHKIPRSIRWATEIPSTGRGKVDRPRVRELMASARDS